MLFNGQQRKFKLQLIAAVGVKPLPILMKHFCVLYLINLVPNEFKLCKYYYLTLLIYGRCS